MDTNVIDMARWNKTTILSLVCVVALALSGCLTASAATAKEHQGKATDEAQSDWAADAQLVGIFGMEGTNQGWEEGPWSAGEDQSENYFASAEEDDDVGDGRSEVWAYGYQAESKPDEFFIVFFDKDGDRQGDMTVPAEDDMLPIGDYDLNSDEAVDKANRRRHRIGPRDREPLHGRLPRQSRRPSEPRLVRDGRWRRPIRRRLLRRRRRLRRHRRGHRRRAGAFRRLRKRIQRLGLVVPGCPAQTVRTARPLATR